MTAVSNFAEQLLSWFDLHGRRDLPWQVEPTPYRVWISEIMLQQTQVATVIPYYARFMQSYPDVSRLAAAAPDEVMHHWSGLGYYARCRNLHKAAAIICSGCGGRFPVSFEELIALPGIGRSTAGAILALSRGERHAILDGNAKRVLARYHGIGGWPGKPAVANALWQQAEQHTPFHRVADYTQAIMDLGATLCTRSRPRCAECPLQAACVAHADGRETEFPGRKDRKARPQKDTVMVLAVLNNSVYLERRPPAGIWGGLWSLPEIASAEDMGDWLQSRLNVEAATVETWPVLRHSFSHYDLDIEPLAVRLAGLSRKVADLAGAWYPLDQQPSVGLAAPVSKLLAQLRDTQRKSPD